MKLLPDRGREKEEREGERARARYEKRTSSRELVARRKGAAGEEAERNGGQAGLR